MELTNSETFCISCHEMEQNVFQEYRRTGHYENRTGVRATCPDCHVPKEWTHKVIRKLRATNELYHWLKGSINTREKFEAKRLQLASHVWDSMRASDSRECRNCHEKTAMGGDKQSATAKKIHQLSESWGDTCIDCHQGIAHQLPRQFDRETIYDSIHQRIEQEGVACQDCHEDLYQPPGNDEW